MMAFVCIWAVCPVQVEGGHGRDSSVCVEPCSIWEAIAFKVVKVSYFLLGQACTLGRKPCRYAVSVREGMRRVAATERVLQALLHFLTQNVLALKRHCNISVLSPSPFVILGILFLAPGPFIVGPSNWNKIARHVIYACTGSSGVL